MLGQLLGMLRKSPHGLVSYVEEDKRISLYIRHRDGSTGISFRGCLDGAKMMDNLFALWDQG